MHVERLHVAQRIIRGCSRAGVWEIAGKFTVILRLSRPRLFQQRQGLRLRLVLGFGSWADRLQVIVALLPGGKLGSTPRG